MWTFGKQSRTPEERDETTALLVRAGDLADRMQADAQALQELVAEIRTNMPSTVGGGT